MIERLKRLMEMKGLSASGIAEELEVQPSGISHILNGRNKPSLDLLQKIIHRFPEVSTDWLLMGKGKPLKADNEDQSSDKSNTHLTSTTSSRSTSKEKGARKGPSKKIDKIVIFYDDSTATIYYPGDQ
jgi:transcriptional regulator with XRE-family HTH domain